MRKISKALATVPVYSSPHAGAMNSHKLMEVMHGPVDVITRAWKWLRQQHVTGTSSPRLKLEHSISLGQKRFAALIEVQGVRFLVGGGASNVSLLAKLDNDELFETVLDRASGGSRSRKLQTKKKPAARRPVKADQTA